MVKGVLTTILYDESGDRLTATSSLVEFESRYAAFEAKRIAESPESEKNSEFKLRLTILLDE
jgi:hypothetical protein